MRKCREGFTLIELLVVIAIIAILAAILFPVFAKARASARTTACAGSMKNMGMAVLMYARDNNDSMVYYEYAAALPPGKTGRWMWYRACESYIKKGKVFKCPELPDTGAMLDPNSDFQWNRIISFGANTMHAISRSKGNMPNGPRKMGHIKRPSQTMMLADSWDKDNHNDTTDPLAGQGLEGCPILYCKGPGCFPNGSDGDKLYGQVAPRHNNGANVYFVDGHLKWMPIANIVTTDPAKEIWGHYDGNN